MALTMCIHVQRYRSTDTKLYQPMSEAAHSSVTCNSLHQVKQSYKQNPSSTSSCNYSDVPMCAENTMQCAGPTAVKPLLAAAAGNSSDRETDTVLYTDLPHTMRAVSIYKCTGRTLYLLTRI